MDVSLRDFARMVSAADSLEDLTRTLLVILENITGLESVYLTRIDPDRQSQKVIFANNTQPGRIDIPEGLVVPWKDTVCRRAIEDQLPVTARADEIWADLKAVQDLRIRTYMSEPMRGVGGELLGTLCAVSDRQVSVNDDVMRVVNVFAQLIAHHLEREQVQKKLRQDNVEMEASMTTDLLTGIANRRGLMTEIHRALAHTARRKERVVLAFIDLDRFKVINDLHGHTVGDQFLVAIAARLAAATRSGELIGRYGGDEFVVVGSFTQDSGDVARLSERFAESTRGHFVLGETEIDYAGASVGAAVAIVGEHAEALLHRADQAMYEVKQATAQRAGGKALRG